ncbi:MAG: response regulator transcription factor [Gemmatimonadaceae bacterium]
MSLALSSTETKLLQSALRVLAAPLAYPDLPSWSAVATQHCAAFLRADQALFGLMRSDTMIVFGHGAYTSEAVQSYTEYYWRHDFVLTERRFQLGRETYHRDMLYRPGEMQRDPVYNEWSRPNRFCDTIGMSVEATNPTLAGIHFYHDTETGEYRARGVELLDLLLPAFKVGIYTWLALGTRRDAYLTALDAATDGVLLTTTSGEELDESPKLQTTLQSDPERERVSRVMRQAAATLGVWIDRHRKTTEGRSTTQPIARDLTTRTANYRILASAIPEGSVARDRAITVTIARLSPRTFTVAELRDQFGLTPRQAEVARLIADGQRNSQIASALGISSSTALHHTEEVLRKLNLHSRAAVTAALLRR